MKERKGGAGQARLWARGIHGPDGQSGSQELDWGSLGGCEGSLGAASKRSSDGHPFQPRDFPEGTLTKSRSQSVTGGEMWHLLSALLPEDTMTKHLRVDVLPLPTTSHPEVSPESWDGCANHF